MANKKNGEGMGRALHLLVYKGMVCNSIQMYGFELFGLKMNRKFYLLM